jgi:hypothetical protein
MPRGKGTYGSKVGRPAKKKKSVKKYPGGGSTGMYTGDYSKNSGMLDKEGSSMMTARYGMSTGKKKLGTGGTRRIGPMTEAEAMANSAMLTQGLVPNTTNMTPADSRARKLISTMNDPIGAFKSAMEGQGMPYEKRLGGTTCSGKSKRRVKTRRDFK